MSKIGKIFSFAVDPLGLFKKKKKTVFIPPTAKAVAKQTSIAEVTQRRKETVDRLRSGRVTTAATARATKEEEEETIKRAGARRAKLLGS